jgi:hypothetical protein
MGELAAVAKPAVATLEVVATAVAAATVPAAAIPAKATAPVTATPSAVPTEVTARRGVAGSGSVDADVATLEFDAVELRDGAVRIGGALEGDESKSTGTAGFAVSHNTCLLDGANLGEGIVQVLISGLSS